MKADGSAAAAGHSELVVEIVNQGTAACTLTGFPTVVGTLSTGATVRGADTTDTYIGMASPGTGPSRVTLVPGGEAWLPLNFSDNPINGATSCPAFSSFTVTPPGVDHAYPVQLSASASGSPSDCAGIKVPPVLSAAQAVIPSGG
ncbi:DUF4232 domain-containing protein [Actinospica durhamensis]|uniref:DUF4232 domain-containing protein n=1 Tax=Actinospica durhamensis TaxID=1508375 RepID=A0A941EWV7_9ACTN|nr:DUF4232 domain-containing protein [Actinospica durhamensis]MBR7835429.1 DUF4232 domain-containing protein [Actinospica durhamensis]